MFSFPIQAATLNNTNQQNKTPQTSFFHDMYCAFYWRSDASCFPNYDTTIIPGVGTIRDPNNENTIKINLKSIKTNNGLSLLQLSTIKGDKGDKGDSGENGSKGTQGDTGPRGVTGAAGAKGDKGDKGDQGSDGTDGKNGTDGQNGMSYTIGTGLLVTSNTLLSTLGATIENSEISDGVIEFSKWSNNGCSNGAIPKYNSTSGGWECGADNGDTYNADGDGIFVSSNIIALELDGTTLSKSSSGLKVNTISSTEITDGSIQAIDIADNIITAGKIASNALDFSQLKDNATIDANTDIAFNSHNFTFSGTGNVGIGNTLPAYKLDVNGTLGVEGTAYFAGNVGIGTTSPGTKLEVVGTGKFSDTLDISKPNGIVLQFSDNTGVNTISYAGALVISKNGSETAVTFNNSTFSSDFGTVRPVRFGNKVAIGNDASSPSSNLEILGNASIGLGYATISAPTNGLLVQGNLGIGTTTPGYKLDVNGTLGVGGTAYFGGNVGIGTTTPDASLTLLNVGSGLSFRVDDVAGDTTPYVIDDSGRVGIGMTAPSTTLDVDNGSAATIMTLRNGVGGDGYGLQITSGGTVYNGGGLITNSTQNFQFKLNNSGSGVYNLTMEDGSIGIGTTNPGSKLSIVSLGSSTGTALVIDSNGNIWKDSSSLRYKEDITPLEEDFSKVLELSPISYQYKGTNSKTIGYIAEDLDARGLKDLVVYDNQGKPDAIKYDRLSIYLLEILKQQQKTIDGFIETQHITSLNSENISKIGEAPTISQQLLTTSEGISFTSQAEFKGPAIFYKLAEFFEKTVFHNGVEVDGKLTVKDQLVLNSDAAGRATILKDTDTIHVTFIHVHTRTPIVTLTSYQHGKFGYVSESSPQGFTIKIDGQTSQDLQFNWTAVETDSDIPQIPTISITPTPAMTISATPTPTSEPIQTEVNPIPESTDSSILSTDQNTL